MNNHYLILCVFILGISYMLDYIMDKQKKKDEENSFYKKYTKERIIKKLDEYQFTLKLERRFFISLCMRNEKYGEALFKKRTRTLVQSIDDSVTEDSNLISLLNGFTNSGKSRMAQSLLYLLKNSMFKHKGIEYPIYITYTKEEMKEVLETIPAPFGMIQDEMPNESGKDKQLKLEAIKNISDSIRIEQISIIVCTPIKEGTGFINFRLYMCGTNKKKNMLRAFVFFGDSKIPDGMVEIPYHQDKEFFDKYSIQKLKYTKGIRKKGGFIISDFNREKTERDVNYFYEKFKKLYGTKLKSKNDIIALMEFDDYNETENFKNRVASLIRAKIIHDLYTEESEEENTENKTINYTEYSVSEKPVLKYEDLHFRDLVFEALDKKLTREDLEVFRGICDRESFRLIASRIYRKPKNTKLIHTIKERVQENFLGYAGELAYKKLLTDSGKEFEYIGENTPDPDFVNYSDKEVISFKTYTLLNDSKAKKEVGISHIRKALELNFKCFILMFIVQENYFYKFSVSLPPILQNNKKESLPTLPTKTEPETLPLGKGGLEKEGGLVSTRNPPAFPPELSQSPSVPPNLTDKIPSLPPIGENGSVSINPDYFSKEYLIQEYQELKRIGNIPKGSFTVIENLLVSTLKQKVYYQQANKEEAEILLEILNKAEFIANSNPKYQNQFKNSDCQILKGFCELIIKRSDKKEYPLKKKIRRKRR